MFSKELNTHYQAKAQNMMLVHRKQDLQKRKEHFLYDFNISGKYKILKERIKKSIVKICRDKFGKSGSITGITTGQQDQFYSELYVFLMEEMRRVLVEMVNEKKEALMEDQLLTKEYAQTKVDAVVAESTNESKAEQLARLGEEYEILNNLTMADKHFKQLVQLFPKDHNSLYEYAMFSLRIGNYKAAEESIENAISFNNDNAVQNQQYYYNRCISRCQLVFI